MKKYGFLILLLSFLTSSVYADDTEVYLGNPDADKVNPNVLFVFDTSGSMKTEVCVKRKEWQGAPCEEYKSRLQITKEAAKSTIDNLTGINLALMQFNDKYSGSDYGGYMDLPMLSLDDDSHKKAVLKKIDSYKASTWTPITEAVHEAYLYMTGGEPKYGKSGSARYSHEDTYTGTNNSNVRYISPITETCQKNHIVLFTDGGSTYDGQSDSDIRSLMKNNFGQADLANTGLGFKCTTNNSNNENNTKWANTSCLQDLAYVMNNTDASSLEGKQTIQFHTIGGFIGGKLQETLDSAAIYGGGVSANAQTPEELEEALLKVFQNIVQTGGTFAAPSVAVNAFNNLEQLDQLYYSVFKPHEAVGWSGNIKRYRMAGDKIVDAKSQDAIDDETGFFKDGTRSFWSQTDDGSSITLGGMASRLQDERVVVSNLVSNDLMSSANRIKAGNPNITRELMGTKLQDQNFEGSDVNPDVDSGFTDPYSANEFTKLINWVGGLEGKDGANRSRRSMEDPLHSSPVLLTYGELSIGGKKVPDSTLFVGTNSGYLHAFDTNADQPQERFAFIPKELLPVATKYYEAVSSKKYGLDGHISVWHEDTNKDGMINNGEKAYLYIGMRRGGSSYYALDVSNRDNPKLVWQINGKHHQSGPTSGFEELGQTWSRMMPVDVKWNGVKTKVLIFAGGYDIAEDSNFTRKDHKVGNAIYMVDAKTGKLLWKASEDSGHLRIDDMESAITGNVIAIDDDSDGYVDLLYVADLGGRIFRIDFNREEANKGNTNASMYATGGVIADLGVEGSQVNHVRFYDTLDVVYSREFSYVTGSGSNVRYEQKPRYMLNIGSGYRAHPLDNSALDNFYVVFDYNINGPALSSSGTPKYSKLKKSDLQEYGFSGAGELKLKPTTKSNNGFYIKLMNAGGGEKVLSGSLTLNNVIYFTTFRPSSGRSSNSCTADIGSSRLYSIMLASGEDTVIQTEDLNMPGIPPKPVVVIPAPAEDCVGEDCISDPKVLIGTEVIDAKKNKFPLKKTFWREVDAN